MRISDWSSDVCSSDLLTFASDVADRDVCRKVIDETLAAFGKLDILVNNAAEQHPQEKLEDISEEQWEKTFLTNIFVMFQMTKASLPHLAIRPSIIHTTSVPSYKPIPPLLSYSSTTLAFPSFSLSLSFTLPSPLFLLPPLPPLLSFPF